MSIRIEITIEKGETLLGRLLEAGILADTPVITAAEAAEQKGLEPPAPGFEFTAENLKTLVSAATGAVRTSDPQSIPAIIDKHMKLNTPVFSAGELATIEANLMSTATGVHIAEAAQQPAPTRRRGRPPKNPPATIQDTAAQVTEPSQVFAVRRYGGELDYEFVEAKDAVARLKTLIEQAADSQALDSLAQHNEPLSEMLTEEQSEEIGTAFDAAYAALAPAPAEAATPAPAPVTPAAPAEAPWPRCEDKVTPLTMVALDAAGAKNALFAIAEGPPPKFGMVAARAFMDEFGLVKLRDLGTDAAKTAAFARRGAEILGLPTNDLEGLL